MLNELRRTKTNQMNTGSRDPSMTEAESIKVSVIVPALNEAGNIGPLVRECLDQRSPDGGRLLDQVVVVDNGSHDATALEASEAGALVVSEPRQGYGFACAAGSAVALKSGSDVLVYLDADHSSRPSELELVVAPVLSGEARLVLGSRTGQIAPGAMPPHQRFGNWMSAALMRRLYRIDVTDLGPYRAIDSRLFEELDMQEMTFGWPTEMTVKAANRGATIVEVAVSWDTRREGKSKVGGTIKGSLLAARHILGVTIRYRRPS